MIGKSGLKWVGIIATFCYAAYLTPVWAKEPASHGPKGRSFGAGIVLGEPTGITGKTYVTPRWAIDGIASWSFSEDAFTLIGDGIYEILDLPVESTLVTLPFYVGGGGKLAINANRGNQPDKTTFGVRVPVGIGCQWIKYPVEVFGEIAPGMELAPDTEFDITGGIGVRYYF